MRPAKVCCLLTLLALTATGCFSAKPSRGRVRELTPDREVSEPQVPPRDSAEK